ncbi:MAG: hypothetical protein AAFY03_05375, partial [Pseudomonadota bacterium]
GYFYHDIANDRTHLSKGMFELLRMDAAVDAPSMSEVFERFQKEDRNEVSDLFEQSLATGEPHSETVRLLDGSEELLPCEMSWQARRDQDGRITHLFGDLRLRNLGRTEPA